MKDEFRIDDEEIYKKQIETCEQVRNYINALFVNKNKIREVIKKYYNDYEEQKRYRYTRDVEEEQSVLKDIEKELLEEK